MSFYHPAHEWMLCQQDSVTSVAISGWCIFGASVDGTIRRYDIRMGRSYCDQLHHPITSVALSHDGLCVLAACLDSALRLLDRDSGELLASYTGHVHQSVKMDCTLTPSDAHVIGSSESGVFSRSHLKWLVICWVLLFHHHAYKQHA